MARNSETERMYEVVYYLWDAVREIPFDARYVIFWSKSTDPRTLLDIAARYARENEIPWDSMSVKHRGNLVAQRKARKRAYVSAPNLK